ncbi:MAG: asparagine synthase (glutamine-hydrolyzing) [Arenicella sp.]|nr:asparagine synthase (glutamine-hydrolyzing) [Arenicella sp.]
MCGIAGAVSTEVDSTQIQRRVKAMLTRLQHRGPDDQGAIHFDNYAASLAHTRLAIIDLSDDAHQPMRSIDDRFAISFNGEIYNYRALREELIGDGEEFFSQSDTEVILKLYQREGIQCLQRLRGMYAFFIWDSLENTGFAARDPLGIKPFYYWHDATSLAFASELRALADSQFFARKLSAHGVSSYLLRGSVSEPYSMLDQVKQLEAGHYLQWQAGSVRIKQFADLNFAARNMSKQQAIAVTRKALQDSVRAHLVSDVPVGIFLSGGLDSTAIVALASQITDQPISTYSIAFEDPEWNEGDIAKRVADHFGTHHTEWLMREKDALPLFDQFLQAVDQPTIDGFNTFCVAKLASDHGQKVVLSGVGGDELFAGYKSFSLLPKMTRLARGLKLLAPLFNWASNTLNRSLSPRARRSLDFLSHPDSLAAAYQSLRGIFSRSESSALMRALELDPVMVPPADPLAGHLLDQVSEAEISNYMRNQLLRDSDVMSMAWGLELRVPLVDHKLVTEISAIPAALRLQQGKKLLIESIPEIPQWVIERPKQGFRFPFDQWFQQSWNRLESDVAVPGWIPLVPWYRRWSLLVLADWSKRYL